MINKLTFIKTSSKDPVYNLALEEYLLYKVQENEVILYLWQNEKTVVIGRNQNAYRECNVEALLEDGGHLVRRLSGGGAVYHDLGNLNFTFLTTRENYDVVKQTDVILKAVQSLNIDAQKNGRNDLTINGRKFSGHAYYRTGNQCYHHGTLMVDVDTAALNRYLQVNKLKLQAKAVASVTSRVVNLKDLNSELTIEGLKEALLQAFREVYELPAQELSVDERAKQQIEEGVGKFADDAWIYGKNNQRLPRYVQKRFDWGLLQIEYSLKKGSIDEIYLYSDGLAADYLSEAGQLIKNCPIDAEVLTAKLASSENYEKEIAESIIELLTQGEQG